MLIGRGIVESDQKIGDAVDGLTLFPHQVAVRVMEVYASGVQKMNEHGQVLRECIGRILRWSRTFIEDMNMESQERKSTSTRTAAFDFKEDNILGNTIKVRNMEVCEDEESMQQSGSEGNMGTKQTSSHICGVDGLLLPHKNRKYKMAQRMSKEKGPQRTGSSRAEKVSLANVEE